MILVAGATGFLGREICRRLTSKGRSVRGLVRATSDDEAVRQLGELGVETVEGDLRHSASLEQACDGVETVISTATVTRTRQPGDTVEATDQQGQLNLVDAARWAGVDQFIYVSYSGNIGTNDPLTTAKRTVEQRVRESGMIYTILRPTMFMEVWLGPALGFDFANARATIYGDGKNRISWVSLRDVAAFAVRAVDDPAAANMTIEIGGPEALSPNEVVHIFEETSGRRFDVQHVPDDALRAQAASGGDSLQRSFGALMLGYAKGDEIAMDDTLKRYPVKLTSVQEYARDVVSTARPPQHAGVSR
jgi:NADH dehydrogenase